jgi:hypothetical protein
MVIDLEVRQAKNDGSHAYIDNTESVHVAGNKTWIQRQKFFHTVTFKL